MKKLLTTLIITASLFSCKAQSEIDELKQNLLEVETQATALYEENQLLKNENTRLIDSIFILNSSYLNIDDFKSDLPGTWIIPNNGDTVYGYTKEVRDLLMSEYWNGFELMYPNGIKVSYSVKDSILFFKASVMEEKGERVYVYSNPIITGYSPINLDSLKANTVIINE